MSQGRLFCSKLLSDVIQSYPDLSRSRQQCAIVLSMLARSAGIDPPCDHDETLSKYKPPSKLDRATISDQEIIECAKKIKNLAWKRVYGLMAIYGLRNYEAFFCDFSRFTEIKGFQLVVRSIEQMPARIVTPCPFQWLSLFDLQCLHSQQGGLPRVQTNLKKTTFQQIGQRASEQFRRYGLKPTPSDLRHSWAVRSIVSGMPATIGARMLGVNVSRHVDQYLPWIDERDNLLLKALELSDCTPVTEPPF